MQCFHCFDAQSIPFDQIDYLYDHKFDLSIRDNNKHAKRCLIKPSNETDNRLGLFTL